MHFCPVHNVFNINDNQYPATGPNFGLFLHPRRKVTKSFSKIVFTFFPQITTSPTSGALQAAETTTVTPLNPDAAAFEAASPDEEALAMLGSVVDTPASEAEETSWLSPNYVTPDGKFQKLLFTIQLVQKC